MGLLSASNGLAMLIKNNINIWKIDFFFIYSG
jgi:hypothetical protein